MYVCCKHHATNVLHHMLLNLPVCFYCMCMHNLESSFVDYEVAACLTILASWLCGGCPGHVLPILKAKRRLPKLCWAQGVMAVY